MEPLGYHLVFRALDSRVLAPDPRRQRALATAVHTIGEERGLLAFRATGDHLHLAAACSRSDAGKLARSVAGALTRVFELPGFHPTYLKPLADQSHRENVFLYVLGNTEKHGVCNDPAHEASSIGALLGLRLAPGGFLERVRRLLPRLDRATLLEILGVAALAPGFQLDRLGDAAAAAVGLPELDASGLAARARAAAVRVAAPHASPAAVAAALAVAARTERRYRGEAPDPPLERAIGLRIGLLQALGERAIVGRPLLAEDRPRGRR